MIFFKLVEGFFNNKINKITSKIINIPRWNHNRFDKIYKMKPSVASECWMLAINDDYQLNNETVPQVSLG